MNEKKVSERPGIYRARKAADISQWQLYREIGINREALRTWEKTGKEPKLKPTQMYMLLKMLECELKDLIDDESSGDRQTSKKKPSGLEGDG